MTPAIFAAATDAVGKVKIAVDLVVVLPDSPAATTPRCAVAFRIYYLHSEPTHKMNPIHNLPFSSLGKALLL